MRMARAWIVSIDEPLFYGRLYKRLIEIEPARIAGVVILPFSPSQSVRRLVREAWYRLRFWGWRGFLYSALRALVSRAAGSGDIAGAARRAGLPVVHAAGIDAAVAALVAERADIVLATVASRVSAAALAAVPGGWVNTHCGALPRYAGMDAPFWSLFYAEPELTVTLHYMNTEYDGGPIISQMQIPNDGRPYFPLVGDLFDCALLAHVDFLRKGWPALEEARQQDPAVRRYFGKPPVDVGKEFRRRGGRFI